MQFRVYGWLCKIWVPHKIGVGSWGLFYDDDGMGTIGASICLYYPVAAYCHRFRGSEFRFRVLGFGLGFRV